MKKYFSLIAVALLAVSSVFTSCSKDDDSSLNPVDTDAIEKAETDDKAASVESDVTFLVWVAADQAAYYDQAYKIEINGTSNTVKLSEMTEETDTAKFTAYVSNNEAIKAYKASYGMDAPMADFSKNMKLYSYNCGKLKTGTAKATTSYTVNANHPTTPCTLAIVPYMIATHDSKLVKSSYGIMLTVSHDEDQVVTDEDLNNWLKSMISNYSTSVTL